MANRYLPKWWAVRMVAMRQVFVMRFMGPIRLEAMRESTKVVAVAGPVDAIDAQAARIMLVRILDEKEDRMDATLFQARRGSAS